MADLKMHMSFSAITHNSQVKVDPVENYKGVCNKVCNLVVFKTTGCYRLFLTLPPVGGGSKFFTLPLK